MLLKIVQHLFIYVLMLDFSYLLTERFCAGTNIWKLVKTKVLINMLYLKCNTPILSKKCQFSHIVKHPLQVPYFCWNLHSKMPHVSFYSDRVIAMMAAIAFGWYHLPPLLLFPLKDKGVTFLLQEKIIFLLAGLYLGKKVMNWVLCKMV